MTGQETSLESAIREAVNFHGHLGPFLVLGVRMGLIGLRELRTPVGNQKLQVTAVVKSKPPFSCTLDGIQVTTHCTVGNGKLKVKNKPETISAIFKLNDQNPVTVALKSVKLKELAKSLPKDRESYKNIHLAREMASAPEQDLFTIKKK